MVIGDLDSLYDMVICVVLLMSLNHDVHVQCKQEKKNMWRIVHTSYKCKI